MPDENIGRNLEELCIRRRNLKPESKKSMQKTKTEEKGENFTSLNFEDSIDDLIVFSLRSMTVMRHSYLEFGTVSLQRLQNHSP